MTQPTAAASAIESGSEPVKVERTPRAKIDGQLINREAQRARHREPALPSAECLGATAPNAKHHRSHFAACWCEPQNRFAPTDQPPNPFDLNTGAHFGVNMQTQLTQATIKQIETVHSISIAPSE
mgnify:CR=1 FL=1